MDLFFGAETGSGSGSSSSSDTSTKALEDAKEPSEDAESKSLRWKENDEETIRKHERDTNVKEEGESRRGWGQKDNTQTIESIFNGLLAQHQIIIFGHSKDNDTEMLKSHMRNNNIGFADIDLDSVDDAKGFKKCLSR